mmetsp:Transcript_56063/g.122016  ORF Transcript_56063/g.122016 Transcript_56063/m.122016 type:complete len:482 (+) Transcript_56063:2019-3464(+)
MENLPGARLGLLLRDQLMLLQLLLNQLLVIMGLGLAGVDDVLARLHVLLELVDDPLLLVLVVPGDGGAHHGLAGGLCHELLDLLLHQDVALQLRQVVEAHGKVLVGDVVLVHLLEHPELADAVEEREEEAQGVEREDKADLRGHQLLLLRVAVGDDDAVLPRRGCLVRAEHGEIGVRHRAQEVPGEGDREAPEDEHELEVELQQDARAGHLRVEQVGVERPQAALHHPRLASLLVGHDVDLLRLVELGHRAALQAPAEPLGVHNRPPREVEHPEADHDHEHEEGEEEEDPDEPVIVAARPVRLEVEAGGALAARVAAVEVARLAAGDPAAAADAQLGVDDGLRRVHHGALGGRGAHADELAEVLFVEVLVLREEGALLRAPVPLVAVNVGLVGHAALHVALVPLGVPSEFELLQGSHALEGSLFEARIALVPGASPQPRATSGPVHQVLEEVLEVAQCSKRLLGEPPGRVVAMREVAFTNS